ncbi:DUF485 domain-containing protein [Sphingomonas phyllosphaerae]|uniref:DUF485 domain-containing protein n=1 Tax=Sphingomonas phyllosphaerae TaxID=257003 RepID=UPI0003FB48CD|nr:DUF485 domain-containing protein [Sphingomonas phyllosphaerae]
MDDARAARVAADPRYRELVRRRGRFTWALTAVMLVAYLGFILLIAFDKAFMARPIGAGVTSIGIVAGFAVIVLAIVLTGIYVRRAARDFDPLAEALRRERDA